MPIKLMGVGFLAAAWLLRRDARRARARQTETGSRFGFATAARVAGIAICLVAAFLCLTGPRGDF